MGRYDYQCLQCEFTFEARHSAKDTLTECPECQTDSLQKIMGIPRINSNVNKEATAGSIVKKTIEEMKEDVSKEKKRLKQRTKK